MLEEVLNQSTGDGQTVARLAEIVRPDAATRLIRRLQEAEMLKAIIALPREWSVWSEVPARDVVNTIAANLSKAGWQRILAATRQHNRQTPDSPWDLSQATHFLAAVEMALTQREIQTRDEKHESELKALPGSPLEESVLDLAQDLRRQMQSAIRERAGAAGIQRWLLSPRALITRLSTLARQARREAEIESALSEAAMYASRMAGMDAERDVALTRVDELRKRLRQQLRVFCEEQGLSLPKPFSREEAYYLHLLNAYFVALAEAEDVFTQRGAALARRQIALESERAETRINGKLLPGLVDAQRELNPLREAFLWERVRHKIALLTGAVVGVIGGAVWSAVESVSNVLIAGITRYAPVVAPALLVGLVTLVAQTIAYSDPLTLDVAAGFMVRALWNGTLALGATLIVYGCWQYFTGRHQERDASSQQVLVTKEKQDGAETADNKTKRSRLVEPVSDDHPAAE